MLKFYLIGCFIVLLILILYYAAKRNINEAIKYFGIIRALLCIIFQILCSWISIIVYCCLFYSLIKGELKQNFLVDLYLRIALNIVDFKKII